MIPGLGRYPGEVKVYQLPYSGLENTRDCIVRGSQSRTQLSSSHFSVTPVSANLLLLSYFELLKSLSLLFIFLYNIILYGKQTPDWLPRLSSKQEKPEGHCAASLPSVTAWDAGILDSFHQGDSSVMPTHTVSPLAVRGHCRRLLFLAVT